MNSHDIFKQPLTGQPVTRCPHCEEDLDDLTFTDGETVTLCPHRYNADAGLMWGRCDNCFETLYLLELAIVPLEISGQFVNDYCWIPESYRRYVARTDKGTHPWLLTEYAGVSDVMVTDSSFKPNLTETAWLDLHCFVGWHATDRGHAFEKAHHLASYALTNADRA